MKTTRLKTMRRDAIFVFGSNLGGHHGAGAARYAERFKGAVRGQAIGLQGQSYAIPTKDASIRNTLPLNDIRTEVERFTQCARSHPQLDFQVTCIGCGLAGLDHADIAPMFMNAPDNCWFDEAWKPWLGDSKNYWGTFNG